MQAALDTTIPVPQQQNLLLLLLLFHSTQSASFTAFPWYSAGVSSNSLVHEDCRSSTHSANCVSAGRTANCDVQSHLLRDDASDGAV